MSLKKWIFSTMVVLLAGASSGAQGEDIFQAVRSGNLDAVKALVAKNPALLKSKTPEGDNLLHLACGAGGRPIVEFLVAQGADLHAENGVGQAPLLYAAYQGHSEILSLLIAKGADFRKPDQRGRTRFRPSGPNWSRCIPD